MELNKSSLRKISFKKVTSLLLLVGVLSFVMFRPQEPAPGKGFGLGERVEYRIHYGIINAAEARVDIARNMSRVNGIPCYRINVFGRTTGAWDVFTKVRDTWR